MFTGLVEEMGSVRSIERTDDSFTMWVDAGVTREDASFGASIAVNGVCLSITDMDERGFSFGLAPETLRLTSLGALESGSRVNLERSVTPTTRMGGHYVQGHVDGVAEIAEIVRDADALDITFRLDPALAKMIVHKGYVAVDGTSLTVTAVGPDSFAVTLIAHTQALVVLALKGVGDPVNIEIDILTKTVARLLETQS